MVLVALAARDSYVSKMTDADENLILMRLTGATCATHSTAGLRAHRPHVVALDTWRAVTRAGECALLTLSQGSWHSYWTGQSGAPERGEPLSTTSESIR